MTPIIARLKDFLLEQEELPPMTPRLKKIAHDHALLLCWLQIVDTALLIILVLR